MLRLDKGLTSKIYKQLTQLNNKKQITQSKMGRRSKYIFLQRRHKYPPLDHRHHELILFTVEFFLLFKLVPHLFSFMSWMYKSYTVPRSYRCYRMNLSLACLLSSFFQIWALTTIHLNNGSSFLIDLLIPISLLILPKLEQYFKIVG